MTRYRLGAIAGIWLADGLVLLFFPPLVIRRVRESLQQNPHLLHWQALGVCLGAILIVCSAELPYRTLWWITGGAMAIESGFLA